MQYVGYAKSYDDVHIDGSLEECKFVAYYMKDNKVLAAAGMQKG